MALYFKEGIREWRLELVEKDLGNIGRLLKEATIGYDACIHLERSQERLYDNGNSKIRFLRKKNA